MHTYDRTAKNKTELEHSDVCLSCRNIRPGHPPEDAIRAFKPTRVEWSYIKNAGIIKSAGESGAKFTGALNTIGGNRSGRDSVDYDGTRLVAPWMTKFDDRGGPGWACVNSPDAAAFRQQWLKDFLELGADAIQHDDWMFNAAAFGWGGCFCSHCMGRFETYLEEKLTPEEMQKCGISSARAFNYREYLRTQFGVENAGDYQRRRESLPLQKEFKQFNRLSTREYFLKLARIARDYRGAAVPLSVNANLGPGAFAECFILDLVDYLVGETPATHGSYLDLLWMLKLADALRLPQVVSPFPAHEVKVSEVRGVLAATYALGHWPLVPWDVWQGPDKKERWFGTPEEYGDIYQFVDGGGFVDGFEAWADVALFVPAVSDPQAAEKIAELGKELIGRLLAAGVPFRTITAGKVGGDLVEIPFDPDDFNGLRAILLCGSPDLLCNEDQARFRELSEGIAVTDPASANGAAKKLKLPAICKADDPMVHVFPRCKPVGPHGVMALHLINRDYDSRADEHAERTNVTVQLADEPFGGMSTFSSAVYHQPGCEPAYLKVETKRRKLCLTVPSLKLWGVINIR